MSIIHFEEAKVIFDLDELAFLKTGYSEKFKKHKLIAKFKNSNKETSLCYGTEEECNEKFQALIEKIADTERTENVTQCQWIYGSYLQVLCNISNVGVVEMGHGVDPDSWNIDVFITSDWDEGMPVTYSSLTEANDDMESIAKFIKSDEHLLTLQGEI